VLAIEARSTSRHDAAAEAPVSRKREGYAGRPADLQELRGDDDGGSSARVPYAELHCHSNFSFLDGASHPEQLVEEAARQGLDALVLTDHDGMYGAVRFSEAARELGIRTGYGAELTLGVTEPQNGQPNPAGEHLLVIARGLEGYRRLCRTITSGQLAGEKGAPRYNLDDVVEDLRGHALVLTGCRKGTVRRALTNRGPAEAMEELRTLVDRFGRDQVAVELIDHSRPTDSTDNDALAVIGLMTGKQRRNRLV
jgi:error-prone DNA polymerase